MANQLTDTTSADRWHYNQGELFTNRDGKYNIPVPNTRRLAYDDELVTTKTWQHSKWPVYYVYMYIMGLFMVDGTKIFSSMKVSK